MNIYEDDGKLMREIRSTEQDCNNLEGTWTGSTTDTKNGHSEMRPRYDFQLTEKVLYESTRKRDLGLTEGPLSLENHIRRQFSFL